MEKINIPPKEKAKELVNMIYQPMGKLNITESSNKIWEWAKDRTTENVSLLKKQIPMYTGNLNPLWKYWDDVEKEIPNI